jgi:hypothetical protein
LFKIAMGARSGPSMAGAAELFSRLARFPSFEALRLAYPDTRPVELMSAETTQAGGVA